jgi:ribosomal protein S18 acetylase RimI-like enzyme
VYEFRWSYSIFVGYMTNPTIIRKALSNDCAAIMDLIHQLARYEKAPEQVILTKEQLEVDGFGPSPKYWCFVAEQEQQLVGFALCYLRYSTWKGARCYLEDILIDERYRGKGIGKMLMNTVIQDARARNFSGVVWQVLEWNEPAIKFYETYQAKLDPEWINGCIDF